MEIKKLISEGRLKEAIAELISISKQASNFPNLVRQQEFANAIVQFSEQYNVLQTQFNLKLIADGEFFNAYNRITKGCLELIDCHPEVSNQKRIGSIKDKINTSFADERASQKNASNVDGQKNIIVQGSTDVQIHQHHYGSFVLTVVSILIVAGVGGWYYFNNVGTVKAIGNNPSTGAYNFVDSLASGTEDKIEDFKHIIIYKKEMNGPNWYEQGDEDRWTFYEMGRFEGTYYGTGNYRLTLSEYGNIAVTITTDTFSDTFVILYYDSTGFKTDGEIKFIRK